MLTVLSVQQRCSDNDYDQLDNLDEFNHPRHRRELILTEFENRLAESLLDCEIKRIKVLIDASQKTKSSTRFTKQFIRMVC